MRQIVSKRARRVALALLIGAVVLAAPPGRSATPDGRFAVGTSEITDSVTGLVWQKTDATATTGIVVWTARSCPAPYRVPTTDELYSLVDDRIVVRGTVAVADPVFGLTANTYWTNDAAGSSSAWSVDFFFGHVLSLSENGEFRVRCVR